MQLGEICSRTVVQCERSASALEVAQLMRESHVGDVVVIDQPNGERIPVGIVTDRDLVLEVMALDRDPTTITAGELMSKELVSASEQAALYETAELMRFKGVRRLPVVNEQGGLIGIVTMDDLLRVIGDELTFLGNVIGRETNQEHKARR